MGIHSVTKPLFLLCLLNLFCQSRAADLVVQDQGPPGTFVNITTAIDSASDGDRIIIVNRSGSVPWPENVLVDKSLTFLPALDGTRFLVSGNWTISPAATGQSIRIVGMENINGDIQTFSDAPAGQRAQVEIAGSEIKGSIILDENNFDCLIAGNIIEDNITIRFGGIYGNDMQQGNIRVNEDAVPGDETIDVIGNRCLSISWRSESHFFRINNNYVNFSFPGPGVALLIDTYKNSSLKANSIENNSIRLPFTFPSGSKSAIFLSSSPASAPRVNVINNAVQNLSSGGSTIGVGRGGGILSIFLVVSYNHLDANLGTGISSGILTTGTNVTNQAVTISFTDGTPSGPAIPDGGHPGKQYTDHDLSRNDPGCYGGSFNFDNYFMLPAGPRVFHVETPRTVNQGASINVTAEGFDR